MSSLLKIFTVLKSWFSTIVLFLGSFLLPLQPLIIVTTIMSLFDWITKIYAVYLIQGKKGVQSKKMADTFYKIIIYAVFLIVLFVVDSLFIKTIGADVLSLIFEEDTIKNILKVPITTFGTLMILAREAKSIDENWEQAFNYSPIEQFTKVFGFLLKWKK